MRVDVLMLVSYDTDAPDVMAEAERLGEVTYRNRVLQDNMTETWVNAVEDVS